MSAFGGRTDPFSGEGAIHTGVDLAAPMGTPVLAAADGVVVYAEWQSGYGRLVIIDFKADSPNGPPPQHRIPPEQAVQELAEAGYTLVEQPSFLPQQYMLIFRKSAP